MTRPATSDVFAMTAHYAANDLVQHHPNPQFRNALMGERIYVYGSSSTDDHRMAMGYGTGAGAGGVLVAMHVGLPQQPQTEHEIMLYEDGVKFAAAQSGVSVKQQVEDTLIHEMEHHFGYAPPGHADATLSEYEATLRAGGTLDARQRAAYEQQRMHAMQHQAAPMFCPCWGMR